MKNLFLIALLIIASCSFKKNPLVNQTHKGHEELYSEPDAPKLSESEHIKRVVIAATNDVEAHFEPQVIEFKDEHHKGTHQIQIGGADAMSAYFNILREQYKNVLLVDSGDIFSAKASFKEVRDFYEDNHYDAVTIGLNDFNLKLPKGVSSSSQLFRDFAKDSNVPLVLSNLYELKTARVVEWKGTLPYLLKDVGGVKVGVIGLVPDDIVSLTPVDNRVALFVENMLQSTLRQARLLRSLGADIVVVMTHQGIRCGHEMAQEAKLPLQKVNFDPKVQACELSSALGTYLERLPPHLVDVVIGGRTQEKMANYVNGNLVLGNFEHGKSMIYAEFFVDTKNRKVLKEQTVVHQPVYFCREFFKATDDCFTQDPSVDHATRVPATFLGKELALNNTSEKVSAVNEKHLINLAGAIGELQADIAFAPSTSGSSQLVVLKISGVQLIQLLEEDYNSASDKNWYPSPYIHENENLQLSIKGDLVAASKEYTVLTDLEAVQSNQALNKALFHTESKTYSGHSWSSFEIADTVKTQMAAQVR